jgi:hypothetical protein
MSLQCICGLLFQDLVVANPDLLVVATKKSETNGTFPDTRV